MTIDAYRGKLDSMKEAAPAVANEPNIVTPTEKDDLKLIKGIGPKLEGILNKLGVNSFAQVAAWTEADIEKISGELGSFKDRITRDNWMKKARKLHNEKYGKGS